MCNIDNINKRNKQLENVQKTIWEQIHAIRKIVNITL